MLAAGAAGACKTDAMHEPALRQWTCASALIEGGAGLLLVKNGRRWGGHDWSPPGGVIDDSDDSLLAGLAREVDEETGLRVTGWEGPVYEVRAVAADMGWDMRCTVFRATGYEGEVRVDDPDGIVVDAAFVPWHDCGALLEAGTPWVREPLVEWLEDRFEELRRYRYEVRGSSPLSLDVTRTL